MKRIVVLAAVVGWSLFYSDLAFSQSSRELSELKREIEALKAGQAAIQKDLTEIKNFILQRRRRPHLRPSLLSALMAVRLRETRPPRLRSWSSLTINVLSVAVIFRHHAPD